MSDGRKGLVLDANILLRAVFGQRVRQILETNEDEARFYNLGESALLEANLQRLEIDSCFAQ